MLAGAAVLLASLSQSNVFRVTPGGGLVSVEHRPASRFHLCLAFRVPASVPPWHAHLAEHILAGGADGNLPLQLQDQGVAIDGMTTRKQVTLTLEGPVSSLPVALNAVGEICGLRTVTASRLDHETEVLRRESELQPASRATHDLLWRQAAGAGPMFPVESDDLEEYDLHALLNQAGAACVVEGGPDAGGTADTLVAALAQLPSAPGAPDRPILPQCTLPSASGLRVGPVGTTGFLAGAATVAALASVPGLGPYRVEFDPGSSLAVVEGDVSKLADPAWAEVGDRARALARALAESWTSDAATWVRLKAASLLGGQRIGRADLLNAADLLAREDFDEAAKRLRGT